jgi:Flp pilus assembly protein TadG
MFKFMKKLLRDRSGNALLIAGAALPLIIGAAGLATDTVQWTLWKRQLQRAADSAALAGVYAEAQGNAISTCTNYTSATYAQPVGWDVKRNNKAWPTTTCAVQNPPTTGSYTSDSKAVKVTLSVQQILPFSGFFVSTAPTITASATATLQQTGSYCLVALKNTTAASITVGGSSNVNLGCGAISNSTSATSAVSSNGNAYTFAASPVAAAGAVPADLATHGATNLQPFHIPEPDPFAGKYPTTIPAGMTCGNFQSHTYTVNNGGNGNNGNGGSGPQHLTPGCYNQFSPSGSGTYVMDAGTYYLDSTDFAPGGTVTLTGTGVTIILTGTNPGSVSLSGNQTIQLSAPTSGTYAKMLFIQASNATTDNLNKINGNTGSYFDGGMYFPSGLVQFNGSSGSMTQCAMVVADLVDFTGNTNLQNSLTRPDGTACTGNQTVTANIVRLVE